MDSGAERADPGDSEQDEEEDVYEVERIIDMRVEDVSEWVSEWERLLAYTASPYHASWDAILLAGAAELSTLGAIRPMRYALQYFFSWGEKCYNCADKRAWVLKRRTFFFPVVRNC